MKSIPTPIRLSELVKSVADELRVLKADDVVDPVMALQSCEVELTVSAKVAPGGKVNFVVWEAGLESEYANAQKVLLKFGPIGGIVAAALTDGVADLPNEER